MNRRQIRALVWTALILVFVVREAWALEKLLLAPEQGLYDLAPYMEVMEDPGQVVTIHDVSSPEYSSRFVPLSGPDYRFDLEHAAYWLRFSLKKKTETDGQPQSYPRTWLLEAANPIIPALELYIPAQGSPAGAPEFLVRKSGNIFPAKPENVLSGYFVLPFPDAFQEGGVFYLRLAGLFPLNTTFTLWTPISYQRKSTLDSLIFGVIYGTILCMLAFNFFIYLSLRDRTYLYYVLYLLFGFLYLSNVQGHFKALLDPPLRWVPVIWLESIALTAFWSLAFTRSFLDTRKNAPVLDMIFGGFKVLLVVGMLLSLGPWLIFIGKFVALMASVGPIFYLAAGFLCLYRGFLAARYFLLAWSILLIGALLHALRIWGLLPFGFFTTNTVPLGMALESVLLSFALADRIRNLRLEKEALVTRERRFKKLSETDGLTGLYNKRFLFDRLTAEIQQAQGRERSLSLIIMDVDDFKRFNDTYGHPEGDKVLKGLSSVILTCIRDRDCACRYGGEEFTVILPDAGAENARAVAERVRRRFASLTFFPVKEVAVAASVSVGLAQLRPGEDAENLIKRADEALYQAKKLGKNRTVTAGNASGDGEFPVEHCQTLGQGKQKFFN